MIFREESSQQVGFCLFKEKCIFLPRAFKKDLCFNLETVNKQLTPHLILVKYLRLFGLQAKLFTANTDN